jgi:DNA polymerase-3 subunit chi
MTTEPTEVLFYHLEGQPLSTVLPTLLEKTLERGWRAVVQVGAAERLETLDEALWTYRPDSFLPHGTASDGHTEAQPIFLTLGSDTPNAAQVRFIVEGAEPETYGSVRRLVFLFDGNDGDAITRARNQWKAAKAAGCSVTYWQQADGGRWVKKA